MKPTVYLSNIASFIGEPTDLSLYPGLVGEPALQKALYDDGFQFYRATESSHAEMCIDCVKQVISSAGKDPAEIDLIVYSSSTVDGTNDDELEDYLMDAGLTETYATGLSGAACGSLGHSIDMAMKYLMSGEGIRNVIVVSVNKCPEAWPRNYYNNTSLLSDGATACLLSKDVPGLAVVDYEYRFDRKIKEHEKKGTAEGNIQAMKILAKHANRIKDRMYTAANISHANIDQVITNYAGHSWKDIYATILDLDPERISTDGTRELGHMFSGEQLISLDRYLERSEAPKEQDNYVLMLFTSENGVGLSLLGRGDQDAG